MSYCIYFLCILYSNVVAMITGETLRLLRVFKGMKRETIAKKLGISQPAYSKLESSSSINGEKLEQLLDVLDCTKEHLDYVLTPPRK